ncbi:MAG: hypothetical protein H7336_09505 [Bacteriovorax sp.]|nr:hypothetical protein [Bacteriovorax sp.]
MIREVLTYLFERPMLPEAKSFGHLAESISLISREKRCKLAWLSHRIQCKEFITTGLSQAKNFESILVLGSGPLHEIPIENLSRTFKKVVLVDIVHLKATRESVAHLTNIEFVEHEISEIESSLKNEKALIEKIPGAFQNIDWGLVLSVNVMSQLPLHLASYIKKKLKNKFSDEEVQKFLERVTVNHLLFLNAFRCPVILITDVETTYTDKNEAILQNDINYTHLTFPKTTEQWIWNVAPIPEFDKNIGMKMLVSAFVLNSIK